MRSDHPCLLELRLHNITIEGFHDVFVGAGADRLVNILDAVLGGAKHHDRASPPSAKRSARKNSMPFMTGMFQSRRMTSGMWAIQLSYATCPSSASSTVKFKSSTILRAIMRTCQRRSKKGPVWRCKKGPLGGCGLVPVVHGRAPRAARRFCSDIAFPALSSPIKSCERGVRRFRVS